MNVIKFNPFAPARAGFGNRLDELFNRSIGEMVGADFTNNFPSVNVSETEDTYKLALAAPGLEKADFNINVKDDQLTISAKREESKEEVQKGKITRREFNYSSFTRSFHLPENSNKDTINATYENGVLAVAIPKIEVKEEDKVKRIEIA